MYLKYSNFNSENKFKFSTFLTIIYWKNDLDNKDDYITLHYIHYNMKQLFPKYVPIILRNILQNRNTFLKLKPKDF